MTSLVDVASLEHGARAGAGIGVDAQGNPVLSGPALALRERIDRALVAFAGELGGAELSFSPLVSVSTLDRLDWFRSFPHLATFAVTLDPAEANIDAFCGQEPVVRGASVHLTGTAPVTAVFTPAACYHVYQHVAGATLTGPAVWTTRNTCCRHEDHFCPLERQWTFSMRELVFAGVADEVHHLIGLAAARAEALIGLLDLPTQWAQATDPFFRGSQHAKHRYQQIDPVKHEMAYRGLALASTNFHYDAIGSAFGITRAEPAGAEMPAVTGCVAFGLERWVGAVVDRHGPDPCRWPSLPTEGAS